MVSIWVLKRKWKRTLDWCGHWLKPYTLEPGPACGKQDLLLLPLSDPDQDLLRLTGAVALLVLATLLGTRAAGMA
jgi:hypothetical protein